MSDGERIGSKDESTPFVSTTCEGEVCNTHVSDRTKVGKCGAPAAHKIEEAIAFDDPNPARHPYTAYVCREHFKLLMGIK